MTHRRIHRSHKLIQILCVVCGFFFLLCPLNADASSLYGKVIEVNSGDVITIHNLNRPVRVKLLGVDAPELNQAFGDVARKHLADLVYDKSVIVEYSGIAGDGSLRGRVLLNDADIGAQMIRDGAAWFDANNFDRLSANDQEVYRYSEQAARNERRGLWQAENPMAPWEFVRAEVFRRDPVARLNSVRPMTKVTRQTSELTNLSLMGSRGAKASSESEEMVRWHRTGGSDWVRLRPAGERFSALVPSDGEQTVINDDEDKSLDFPIYYAQDGMSRYAVGWIRIPTGGETDEVAIKDVLTSFLKGFGQSYQRVGASRGMSVGFACEPENEKSVSMNGFTGTEFDLKSCTVPAKARIFTRVVGKHRQAYIAIAFYMEDDPKVARFMNSFVVDRRGK